MTLPELSIRRYTLAFMLSAVLVLFGTISYQRVGVDRFPYIEFPVVSVTTALKGGNPEVIDASVTSLIESAVNSVPGIEHVQSNSSPGVSVVAVTFNLDKPIDVAFSEVQAKVNQILRRLPKEADPPVVAKVETNASPIFWLALQGDRTQQQLNQYAANVLKKKLETIPGVGEVRLGGRRDRAIRVEVDPLRMAALGVAAQDVTAAFGREHIQYPGGFLVQGKTERLIKLDLEAHDPRHLAELVVAQRGGAPIRLGDFAQIRDELSDYRQLARFNGQPTVGVGIVKVANSNTVAIIDEVQRRLQTEFIPQLPPGMTLSVASNDALFIQEMVDALKEHLVSGTLLAALVVWLFLRSLRSTLIIATAIPVSLLGAVAVMYAFGYTFNTLTLLALLLLIGVVVDDAIVVLENIYRHREEIDPDPVSAAINGSNQVFFAVFAATLALVSIFAPVAFLGGIIGKFFQSFAVVVTFGVLVSLFVSLTLTPMLCSRYLSIPKQHGRIYHLLDGILGGIDRIYRRLLTQALDHRWKIVALTLMIVASSAWFFGQIGKGFVPEEDEGRFVVNMRAPLGSGIAYTEGRLHEVEKVLARHPEVQTYFTAIGLGQAGQVNQALAFVRLKPRTERSLKQQDLLPILRKELAGIPGVRAFASPVPIVSGQRGDPLQFALTGLNLDELAPLARQLRDRLATEPGIGNLDLALQLDLPQLELKVDRLRAADLGIPSSEVAMAVNMLTGGADVAKFNEAPGDGNRYDIRVKAKEGQFTQTADLGRIYLRGADGQMIRLDTVAQLEPRIGPAVIDRFDLQYAALFYGSPSRPMGEVVDTIRRAGAEILPSGYGIKFLGEAEEFGKTAKYMSFAFALALLLLYMVLASQFNSFLQPLIIMVAQPLAVVGGVFALWLVGHTLNIYSMIGLVLLIGLVAKNSILLIDLTNQERAAGRDIRTALLTACPIRLRPVLMTSLTVILALLPAALGLGAGAETNGPLSVAVIGGMISSTLLTLVVVPAVYSLAEGALARLRARRGQAVQE